MFRIQAVSVKSGSFENRVSVCKAYRGLRGEDLNKAAGINDGEFVHMAGFIGGAWSMKSVVKMAEDSVKEYLEEKDTIRELEKK